MPEPAVSVVIPAHQAERYVAEAIESVLAQTPLEVIVVDDGSVDGTRAAVERFGEAVRYVFQERAGAGAARNRGARLARGEYLAFLDSDDMVTPDGYARLLATLERSGSDFATGNIHRFDARGAWPAG